MTFSLVILMLFGHIDGSAQDYGNSHVLAMELPQSCAKPSMWSSNEMKA